MRLLLLTTGYLENNAASVRLSEMVDNFVNHDDIEHIKVVEFAWHLRSSNWKIKVATSYKVSVTQYRGKLLPPILYATIVPNPVTFFLWFFITLKEIIQGHRDTIIVSPPLFFIPIVATYLACLFGRKPFCVDIRDNWQGSVDSAVESRPFYIKFMARLLDRATRKITLRACSKAKLISTPYEAIKHQLEPVCKMPIVIIRNGINFRELESVKREFDKGRVLSKYRIPYNTNSTFIIYSGSFRDHYKPQILFAPLAQVIAEGAKITYIIIGGGEGEEELRRLSTHMKMQGKVFFLGSKNHTEVLELLLASDLAFYTLSKEYPTPECAMGVKALEYIACELPVLCVADNNASVSQLVNQHQLGICVNCDESEALVPALLNLLEFRDKYVENIKAYYPAFAREFDRQGNLDKLYAHMISQIQPSFQKCSAG